MAYDICLEMKCPSIPQSFSSVNSCQFGHKKYYFLGLYSLTPNLPQKYVDCLESVSRFIALSSGYQYVYKSLQGNVNKQRCILQ